jgi:hypothetical protein
LTGEPPNYILISTFTVRKSASRTHLRNQNPVANLNAGLDNLALTVKSTRSNSKNLGLRKLLNGVLRKIDARGSLSLGLDALDENAVEKRLKSLNGAKSSGLRIGQHQNSAPLSFKSVQTSTIALWDHKIED